MENEQDKEAMCRTCWVWVYFLWSMGTPMFMGNDVIDLPGALRTLLRREHDDNDPKNEPVCGDKMV